jgi:CRP/FNR family cyclic AMP-dependent transcriptional regulator
MSTTSNWPVDRQFTVDREFLARIPIFGGVAPELLDRLIDAGTVMRVPAEVQLMGEGDPARSVFVVCEGELEIHKRGTHGSTFRLASLHAGDCVGEMSLIDIQPRSATVRTVTPAVLLRIDHGEIGKLYRSNPEVYTLLVLNIAREISRRLRRADQVLADMGVVVQEMWTSEDAAQATRRPQ